MKIKSLSIPPCHWKVVFLNPQNITIVSQWNSVGWALTVLAQQLQPEKGVNNILSFPFLFQFGFLGLPDLSDNCMMHFLFCFVLFVFLLLFLL